MNGETIDYHVIARPLGRGNLLVKTYSIYRGAYNGISLPREIATSGLRPPRNDTLSCERTKSSKQQLIMKQAARHLPCRLKTVAMIMDYSAISPAALAARSAFQAAILARFSALMFQMKRKAIQEPMPMMAGIRMHISLMPRMADSG